jgi:branched-chain amino acid aminotransferase
MPDELAAFDECFLTGSAAEVTPVSEIAHWRFVPGKISALLMNDYAAEVRAKDEKAAA